MFIASLSYLLSLSPLSSLSAASRGALEAALEAAQKRPANSSVQHVALTLVGRCVHDAPQLAVAALMSGAATTAVAAAERWKCSDSTLDAALYCAAQVAQTPEGLRAVLDATAALAEKRAPCAKCGGPCGAAEALRFAAGRATFASRAALLAALAATAKTPRR